VTKTVNDDDKLNRFKMGICKMPFTECTLRQADTNYGQKTFRIFLLLTMITILCIGPVIGTDDISAIKDTESGMFSYDSQANIKTPGVYIPVQSDDDTARFFYSSKNSDMLLLTGGDLVIMPRSTGGSVAEDDIIFLKFKDHDPRIIPQGLVQYSGDVNFFIGNNSSEWKTDVPLYRSVVYPYIYPGISLVYSDKNGLLKREFVIAPAADPTKISYVYEGSSSVWIDKSGALVIQTINSRQLTEARPVAYQEINGIKIKIPVAFRISGNNEISFTLGRYDCQYPVIIDPEIITSGFLGGEVEDVGTAVTLDKNGIIYVVGYTHSWNFPITQNPFNFNYSEVGYHDIFITAYSKDGRDVLFSTILGGSLNDYARSVIVDDNGTIFISGSTESADFPVKSAYQPTIKGKYDAFVAALNPQGTGLIFSTYLGGTDIDDAFGMAIGRTDHRIYLTGTTLSPDFPSVNAYQPEKSGQYDIFLIILDGNAKSIISSTFLGGRQDDYGRAIALDKEGCIYIGGYTYSSKSSDFPIKNALFNTHPMTYDAFVSKFKNDGSDLIYSTYLGGTLGDRIAAIAINEKNQLFVTGYTFADDFPVTTGAFQKKYGGNLLADAFITGFAPDGQSLVASTYLGGESDDMAYGITISEGGAIFVTGGTRSQSFPVKNSWQQNLSGLMNAFVTGIDPYCNHLIFSSYMGGKGTDHGNSITHDSKNVLYVTGTAGSENFPVIQAPQKTFGGDDDAFLTIISPKVISYRYPVVNFPVIPSLTITTVK